MNYSTSIYINQCKMQIHVNISKFHHDVMQRFPTPLVSRQYFHGTPRPKEIHNTSIYSVVRSKQFITTASHSSLTVLPHSAIWRYVSLENLKHPAVHSLRIGDVMSKSFLSVLTQCYFFVAIITLTGLCYMFEQ